ncbi:MAG TPA: peptidoglycan endopeptidase [Geobacteraceae bacterium]|nr:peptidoglycan endopeptidase [Geobacteraceae bacterium]
MKKLFLIPLFLLLSGSASFSAEAAPRYAVAILPTPVLNIPDFAGVFGGPDGKTLRVDSCGQFRALEFVALPATPFQIEGTIRSGDNVIYRVTTDDYPYPTRTGYFIDSRFVKATPDQPPPRPRTLPPLATVLANLLAAQGSTYVWGGNLRNGIPEMLSLYPPPVSPPDPKAVDPRQLRGVDCSGLLYESTGGFTPRNTSALVRYGVPVPIAGLAAAEIVRHMEPLDLIVWEGHVLIVLDRERVIESRLDCTGNQGGVRVRPLRAALLGIMKSRTPVDDYGKAARLDVKGFVVRRWYP